MNIFRYIATFILFGVSLCAFGAVFRGQVVDVNRDPIEGASVYIHELKMGVSTDKEGEFSVVLEPGRYLCEISSMGYKRIKVNILIGSEDIFERIVLDDEVYELNPAYSKAKGKEDKAYPIMRKAIARAPYHRAQIRQYEAESYIKGNMMITKLPRLVQARAKKDRLDMVVNKRYVAESFSNITFDYPDQYTETILALTNSIPFDLDVVNLSVFMRYSIYQPEVFGRLSPLAPSAFNHYKFEYLGMIAENDRLVNKIRIIPRKPKDPKLISGIIYIVEDSWDVLYVEFRASEMGVTLNLKMSYNELIPALLAPTAYDVDAKVDVMGIKADGKYYSSVKYKMINNEDPQALAEKNRVEVDVFVPPALDEDISTRKAKRIASATENKMTELIAQQEEERVNTLTDRDSVRLERVRPKKDLEVKIVPLVTTKADTLAKIKDEDYWERVRTIPLKNDELESYSDRDSLKKKVDRILEKDSTVIKSTGNDIFDKILYGGRFKIGEKSSIGLGGLIRVANEFNFVDGYHIGQNIYFMQGFGKNTAFRIEPSLYYRTHRKGLEWDVTSYLVFDPIRHGALKISVGEGSADVSNSPAVKSSVNSVASILLGISPVKFDNRRYLEGSFAIDIANGLRFNGAVALERRSPLNQVGVKPLFGNRPVSNIPHNYLDPLIVMHNSLVYKIALSYTPEHYYTINSRGHKSYMSSKWPTFTLYTRATPVTFNSRSSSYGMVGASVRQDIKVGMRNNIKYNFDGGYFYNRDRVSLNDYKFFNATDIIYTSQSFSNSFLLLDHYKYATPKSWLTLTSEYVSDYILLKHIPFIDWPLLYESLHLKALWLPEDKISHFEAGYSIGVMGTVRAGVFVGFDNLKFNGVVFRLEMPISF